ncbi:YebC/PmpR family DNA-binding transcriptional regulator [Candidatus Fermentibacteria bacterium]|nr:YebC/PmpR family DNA-binding transcriptional regulator [Candidatus Fermentibacteria bacterium]
MSGHSKWATIKHKKAAQDAQRGKVFTRLIREISTAARMGGGDQANNPRLRTAVLAAKAANMPWDNVDRAIKKGTGDLPGVTYEETTYEVYGPGGAAILVETLSDNRNRTVAEIRHILSKHGGRLADVGSVAWMFETRGLITVDGEKWSEDELMERVLVAGADDLQPDEGSFLITTEPSSLDAVKASLEAVGIECATAEVAKVPKNYVPVTGKEAAQLLKLIGHLEDQDDVQKLWANCDIAEEDVKAAEEE